MCLLTRCLCIKYNYFFLDNIHINDIIYLEIFNPILTTIDVGAHALSPYREVKQDVI